MDALVKQREPFALLFLDTAEDEAQAGRKLRTLWLKRNKTALAGVCRGIVSIEPDKAKRLLKRAQGAALAVAFGLTLKIVADRSAAEALARRLVAGETLAEGDEE